jgi:hypothetical protein
VAGCRESRGVDGRKSTGEVDQSRVDQAEQTDKAQAPMKSSTFPYATPHGLTVGSRLPILRAFIWRDRDAEI